METLLINILDNKPHAVPSSDTGLNLLSDACDRED